VSYLDDVAKAALDNCPGLLYELLPEGTISGHYYKCGSLRGGRGDSTTVNLQSGKWGEWAGGPTGGNLIQLYKEVKGIDFKQALHELADRYGIKPEKRAKTNEQDWTVALPVPTDAYQCNEDMTPILPEGVLRGTVDQFWPYLDQEFNLLMFVARINKPEQRHGKTVKDFFPVSYWRHKDGHFAWRMKELPPLRPLFNLEKWHDGIENILIVEGEKTVRAAERLLPDCWVTCWPGGSRAVHYADWAPVRNLMNHARTLLWPDNDQAGQIAMTSVSQQLALPVDVLSPDPRWPEGYDIADLERDKWTQPQVEEWIAGHVTRIQPEPPPERIEVYLDGADTYSHMQAMWQALAQTKAPLYNTIDGLACLKKNIFSKIEIERLKCHSLTAFLLPYIRTKRHMSHGPADWNVDERLAEAMLFSSSGHAPALEGVYHTPIFLPDGTLVDSTGYNKEARSWVEVPEGYEHGMEVDRAWEIFDDLLADFPFETRADKAGAMAFVISGFVRRAISGPTPLFRFESPTPGTGKTLLCRVLAEILTPHVGMLSASDQEEESRKAITSALLQSPIVTIFDNVEKFGSSALESVLTAEVWKDRILGETKVVEIPVRTLWCATLNNPALSDAMFRRTVRIRLNANCTHPDQRNSKDFRHPDIVAYTRRSRGLLISAIVSMIEFGWGSKAENLPLLGSYEDMVERVCPILEQNGYSGFLETLEEDREITEQEDKSGFKNFVHEWWSQCGQSWVTVKRISELIDSVQSFEVKRSPQGNVSLPSFGMMLKKRRGTVTDGLTLQGPSRDAVHGASCYRLFGTPTWDTAESGNNDGEEEHKSWFE
jgi:hypothetical protein